MGGVAIAVRSGGWELVAAEQTQCFVVAVVRGPQGLSYVVAGVYIPPHESVNLRERYVDVIDSLSEALSRLQLAHDIPASRVTLVGDWNAHISHLPCGEVVDCEQGDCGGPRGARWYLIQRHTHCRAVAQAARGASLNRACTRHGWLVLNGRCPSDPRGVATNFHGQYCSVIDLAVVPREARGDMAVWDYPGITSDGMMGLAGGQGHRVLWVTLQVPFSQETGSTQQAVVSDRPVPVQLTGSQLQDFRKLSWGDSLTAVDTVLTSSPGSRDVCEEALACFEGHVQAKLAAVSGVSTQQIGCRRTPPLTARVVHPVQQPWFDDRCAAARRAWRAARHRGAPASLVASARREYRSSCRHARTRFIWQLEHFRASDPHAFWEFLKVRPPPPVPPLGAFRQHFSHLFGEGQSSQLSPLMEERLAAARGIPFSRDEVVAALGRMRWGKSSGLGVFPVDVFRKCSPDLYEVIARLFTAFSSFGYPRRLNTLLLMPLYKCRGDPSLCDNYRGISLIHPLGRWFSKCVEARLAHDRGAQRARGQSGFRKRYRVEDNVVVLQTACQAACIDRQQLFAAFIDLRKAYDCIDRGLLFTAFVEELGVSAATVATLRRMYTDVQAQVLHGSSVSAAFGIDQGVLQGCPASPLVFSLFMDRLEAYLERDMESLTYAERESVRVAGLLVPLLLFADDIVLASRSFAVLQRLLLVLEQFCDANGLTVNLGKSAWVVGGCVPRASEWAIRYYKGAVLPHSSSYKYLGLVWDGSPSMGAMISARLTAAQAAWARLVGVVTSLGWRDRATRLLLFDTYVRTSLLYGGPVWGMEFLRRDGDLSIDTMGRFGVFYRRCLRSFMGLPFSLRNELLYILSGRPPLQLPLAAMVHRYLASLTADSRAEERLAGTVLRWATGLDLLTYHRRLSLCAASEFVSHFESLQDMQRATLAAIRVGLGRSDRLIGRPVLAVWRDLATLAFGKDRKGVRLPAGWTRLRERCPSFRFAWARDRPAREIVCPRATWLQLPDSALHRLIGYLYEDTRSVSVTDEAAWLDALATPSRAAWSAQQAEIAALVRANGVAVVLWCCAGPLLEMMDSLWPAH